MEKVVPRKLKGFQDYSPEIMETRFHIMDVMRKHASLAGFEAIGTPALEYADVLLGVGGETDKQVYKFLDNGEREVALRFDLTVPFARYVGERHGEMSFPFKRLQIGDVWRAEKPQKGRYREFCQCDLDIIGANTQSCDMEVIATFTSILSELIPSPFTVSVGHRTVLMALLNKLLELDQCQVDNKHAKALITLDKLHKIGPQGVAKLLREELNSTPEQITQLLDVFKDPHAPETLERVTTLLSDNPSVLTELDRLKDTVAQLQSNAPSSKTEVIIDLSIARGLGYYTGIVFETTMDALPNFGSICSGGRYDQLAQRFIDRDLSGVGGSIGLDRLTAAFQELNFSPVQKMKTFFVAIADESVRDYAMKLCLYLRQKQFPTHINIHPQKLGNQFKQAVKNGYTGVITLGEAEKNKGEYTLKILSTTEERKNLTLEALLHLLDIS